MSINYKYLPGDIIKVKEKAVSIVRYPQIEKTFISKVLACCKDVKNIDCRYLILVNDSSLPANYYRHPLSVTLTGLAQPNILVVDDIKSYSQTSNISAWISEIYIVEKCNTNTDKIVIHNGMSCNRCSMHNPYAEPNTTDGKYICYNCRN